MNIGQRMKLRRQEINLSAEKLAEKLGVSKTTIYRYEKGEIEKFPIELVEPIAKALNTTPAYIMGWEVKDDINSIYNQLEDSRQRKVYTYAKYELAEQNKSKHLDDILIAAHKDDDLTQEQEAEVQDYIDNIKKRHNK
ncbi:helix-turn-helix domain-containing protein [Aerococcus urinaeequi]|uniref:helix-turn-helix domain-containing protein n=1 Tax=Aerococcus urinaeequi TaxID=51665 RepID=UPI003D6C6AD0